MFDIKKFGVYLSRLRKNADMTQSELGDMLNLTRQAVSKYELGDSFPDISVLIIIAETFGITLDTLIRAGEPTKGEANILKKVAEKDDITNVGTVSDIVNIAPLLKPSILEKMSDVLAKKGIDISSVVKLAEYLSEESVIKLLENANFNSINSELLEKLIPFLDEKSKSVIFAKILEGELDWRLIEVILPHAEYLTGQIEAAVIYGELDKEVLKTLNNYWYNKYGI